MRISNSKTVELLETREGIRAYLGGARGRETILGT